MAAEVLMNPLLDVGELSGLLDLEFDIKTLVQ